MQIRGTKYDAATGEKYILSVEIDDLPEELLLEIGKAILSYYKLERVRLLIKG